MELVYMDGRKEPYTLSSIVAECTGLQHHTITKTIRKHQARFERFGKVGFKIQAMESGQNIRIHALACALQRQLFDVVRSAQSNALSKYSMQPG